MRQAAKRDSNEPEIISALKNAGAVVQQLNDPAVPDLLVGYNNKNFLLEVKGRSGKLTSIQAEWHKTWKGQANVCKTAEEALATLEAPQHLQCKFNREKFIVSKCPHFPDGTYSIYELEAEGWELLIITGWTRDLATAFFKRHKS